MKKGVCALLAVLACLLTACGVEITGISLPESLELEAGAGETLTVEYASEDTDRDAVAAAAEKLTLKWTSSDEDVATVDGEGTVTALAPGRAEITAATEDGALTAVCPVTVGVGLTGLDAPEALTLELGKTDAAPLGAAAAPQTATDVKLTYASSDETVATVDEEGTVTALAPGECTVTAEAEGFGGTTARAETKVTVKIGVTGITLSSEGGALYVGNSATVKVYTLPREADAAAAAQVKYTSSDESVATVSGTTEGAAAFTVKGVGTGSATITVEYGGLTARYTVSVTRYVAPRQPAQSSAAGSASGGQAAAPAPAPQPSAPAQDAGGSTDSASSEPTIVYGPGAGVGMPGDTIIGGGGYYPPDRVFEE